MSASDNIPALDRVDRWHITPDGFGGIEWNEDQHGAWVRYDDYQRTLSAALQYKHELEQCQLDLAQHQGNASEVIRLQAENADLKARLERMKGANYVDF